MTDVEKINTIRKLIESEIAGLTAQLTAHTGRLSTHPDDRWDNGKLAAYEEMLDELETLDKA